VFRTSSQTTDLYITQHTVGMFASIILLGDNKAKTLHAYCTFISTQKITNGNFIQFSLALTKLCYIKRDHRVNFYTSCEKSRSLQQYDRFPQNVTDDAKRVSQVHRPLKILILKIQDGRQPIRLRDLFFIIMRC